MKKFDKLLDAERRELSNAIEEASKAKLGWLGATASTVLTTAAFAAAVAATAGSALMALPLILPGMVLSASLSAATWAAFAKGAQRTVGSDLLKAIQNRDALFTKILKLKKSGDSKGAARVMPNVVKVSKDIEKLATEMGKALDNPNGGAGMFRADMTVVERGKFKAMIDKMVKGDTVSFLKDSDISEVNDFMKELKTSLK